MRLQAAYDQGMLTRTEVEYARAQGITELPEGGKELMDAVNSIVAAMDSSDENDLAFLYGKHVSCDELLTNFVVGIDDRGIRMNRATWDAIKAHDDAYDDLLEVLGTPKLWDAWKEGPVVRAIVKDGGHFAAAAQRLEDQKKVEPVDQLAVLEAAISALVTQAAELRTRPTSSVASTLGLRLGQLREEHTEMARRVAELGSQLDFAAVAVIDAASLPART